MILPEHNQFCSAILEFRCAVKLLSTIIDAVENIIIDAPICAIKLLTMIIEAVKNIIINILSNALHKLSYLFIVCIPVVVRLCTVDNIRSLCQVFTTY